MSIVRTKGLISLVAVVVIVTTVALVFAGSIVKWILQSQLTAANGAEVNIQAVDIGYSPLSLLVTSIAVTDKEQPAENLVEIDKVKLLVKTDSLLKGKFIVSDMSVDLIQFSTQRDKPGEVIKQIEDETEKSVSVDQAEGLSAANLELPDINELMDKAGMKTPETFKALEEKADATQESWQSLESYIEDKQKWDAYKVRYKKIKDDYKKGNTREKLKALKALKKLNKEIKAELKVFNEQRQKLKEDYAALKTAYKQAKKAPDEDLEKLKSSYQLNSGSLENISRLFFDEDIAGYIATAKKYYSKLKPYIETEDEVEKTEHERSAGRFIYFKDSQPEPGFLIEKASFNAVLASGSFEGKATDITGDQRVQMKPTVITLEGKALKHSEAEKIQLKLDLTKRKTSAVKFSYDIKNRKVSDYKIAGGSSMPLMLQSANLNLRSVISVSNSELSGKVTGLFQQAQFKSGRDTSGRNMASMIATSLEQVDNFDIDADLRGKILKPKIKIRSNIDNKVNEKLKTRFAKIKNDYEKELRAKFNQRYSGQIKKIEQKMAALEKYKTSLENRQNNLESKLNKYKK